MPYAAEHDGPQHREQCARGPNPFTSHERNNSPQPHEQHGHSIANHARQSTQHCAQIIERPTFHPALCPHQIPGQHTQCHKHNAYRLRSASIPGWRSGLTLLTIISCLRFCPASAGSLVLLLRHADLRSGNAPRSHVLCTYLLYSKPALPAKAYVCSQTTFNTTFGVGVGMGLRVFSFLPK